MKRTNTLWILAGSVVLGGSVLGLSMGLTSTTATEAAMKVTSTVETSQAKRFELDAVHSSVIFSIKHMGVANFYGRFNSIDGSIHWDNDNPSNSRVHLSIPAASVDTGNDRRDAHLRNPDFFNAPEFPTIDFSSTRIEEKDGVYHVTGDLSMHGVTKPITVELRKTGTTTHRSGRALVGMESKFTVKRSEFDMNYGIEAGALGDEVNLIISLEIIEAAE